jgi:hypothetical protein
MSEIITDNLTGKTTDYTIEVFAGQASGSTTRTNLEQGLAKAWVGNATDSSQSITGDTFNVSGFTDVATGYSTHTLTNNMNTGANTYSVQNTAALQYPYQGKGDSSSVFQLRTVGSTGNSADGAKNGLVHGDLA